MPKLSLQQYILIGLVILLVGQFIWNKRDKQDLLNKFEKIIDEEKIREKKIIDSLNVEHQNELFYRDSLLTEKSIQVDNGIELLNRTKRTNRYLNNKIKDYETNLSYGDRNLDDALDVFSKYKYQSDSISTKEN